MKVDNPFEKPSVAERYDKGRPYFHPLVIERISAKLSVSEKLPHALDIGCGTGLSSKALLEIAESVDAIDSSEPMLARAYKHARISYLLCPAERIGYPDAAFDLITTSQCIHWTEIENCFRQAARVLKNNHYLVIYDNSLLSKLTGIQVWG